MTLINIPPRQKEVKGIHTGEAAAAGNLLIDTKQRAVQRNVKGLDGHLSPVGLSLSPIHAALLVALKVDPCRLPFYKVSKACGLSAFLRGKGDCKVLCF